MCLHPVQTGSCHIVHYQIITGNKTVNATVFTPLNLFYCLFFFTFGILKREIVMEERSVGLESGTEPHERHEMLTKDENSTEINIRFDDLCYSVPEGKGKGINS